jgi:hypothetical protein
MSLNVAAQLERDGALLDVQMECDIYGEEIKLRLRDEAKVDRDSYNSIKQRDLPSTEILMKVYPILFNPNQHQIEKAGLKEMVDVVVYLPMKNLTDNGNSFKDIEMIRSSVILRGMKYWIKDKTLHSQFLDTFLYIVLGLRSA